MGKTEISNLTVQEKRERLVYFQRLLKEKNEPYPMSDIQESFLVGKFMNKNQDHVGCHLYFEFEEKDLDVDRLYTAWNKLVSHHTMLHTVLRKDKLQQTLIKYQVPHFPVYDAEDKEDAGADAKIRKIRDSMSHKVYESEQWPLFDIRISKRSQKPDIIHFSIDEGIADGHSLFLLLHQWRRLYEKPEWGLPVSDFSFKQYIAVMKKNENSDKYRRDLEYFMEKYKNLPSGPNLPYAAEPEKQPGQKCFQRKRFEAVIGQEYWDRLKAMAAGLSVSQTALFLTCFGEALGRWSGNSDFSILNTFFNRPPVHRDIEKVVGPFVTTNIIRIDAADGKTIADKMLQCQQELWEDLNHTGVSGIRALREMRVRDKMAPSLSIPVVFTSMLNRAGKEAEGSWLEKAVYGISQTPQICLDHQVYDYNGGVRILWDAIPEYFESGMIERMFQDYELCLKEIAATGALTARSEEKADLRKSRSLGVKLTDLQQSYQYDKVKNGKGAVVYQEFEIEHIKADALEHAWNILVEIHDMLRVRMDGSGKQYIDEKKSKYCFKRHDFTQIARDDSVLEEIRSRQMNIKLPGSDGNLYEIALSLLPQGKGRLHISLDMAIADGRSINMLYDQLFALYQGSCEIEKPQGSYFDYINYLENTRRLPEAKDMKSYWKNKFHRLPDGPCLPGRTIQTDLGRLRISGQLKQWDHTKRLLEQQEIDTDAFLFTAFSMALSRYSKRIPFTISYVSWKRPPVFEGIDNLFGEFTSLGWIPVDKQKQPGSFQEQAWMYQRIIKEDFRNSAVGGMAELRKKLLAKELDLPVVYTNCLHREDEAVNSTVSFGFGFTATPGVVIDCMSEDQGDTLVLLWDYDSGALDRELAESIFECYTGILNEFRRQLEQTESERLPSKKWAECIHSAFEDMAAKYPFRIAVTYEGKHITYQDLNQKANRTARYLRERGAGKGKMVALYLNRSERMIVMILAVLKTGSAYIPIDPNYPKERVNLILNDAEAVLIVTERSLMADIECGLHSKVLVMDKLERDAEQLAATNLDSDAAGEDCAYVIFTSGSTGRPKGVLIPHSNVIRLFGQTEAWFGFRESDVWSMFHSYAFDFSVWEIWGALLYGGRLVVVPYRISRSLNQFYNLVADEQITVLNLTPTAFYKFMQTDETYRKKLKLNYVIFGGEALYPKKLERWYRNHEEGSPKLINMYGITETTVHVTYREIRQFDTEKNDSVIGVPIPDLNVYLMDKMMNPVREGEEGEIYVSGPGLAEGYLNRPELTRERFLSDPYHPRERLYKTGDLARQLPNGELVYLGRSDFQVQVRGFRVELGDIEAALMRHPDIKEAVAVLKNENENPQIVAYLIPDHGKVPTGKEIRKFVRAILPDYMLPNILEFVEDFPMNENGKLDRKKLTAMEKKISIKQDIIAMFSEELQMKEEILGTDDIFDLGATSITIMSVSQRIAEKYQTEMPIESFLNHSVIEELAAELSDQLKFKLQPERKNSGMKEDSGTKKDLAQIEGYLTQILKESLNLNEEDVLEADIFELGATSITLMDLINKIEETYSVEVPFELFMSEDAVKGIAEYIAKDKGLMENHTSPMVACSDFSRMLSLLRMKKVQGETKYLYPSSGGRNAVQTYVYIKEGAVERIGQGLYYYHPLQNELLQVSSSVPYLKESLPEHLRIEYDSAGFVVFFAAELKALLPVYLDFSRILCKVDTGYISQLLLEHQQECGVRLENLPAVDFSMVSGSFRFSSDQQLIHALLGGSAVCGMSRKEEQGGIPEEHVHELYPQLSKPDVYDVAEEIFQIQRAKQFNVLSKKELVALTKSQPHIRKDLSSAAPVRLDDIISDDREYQKRSSQRKYNSEPVPKTLFMGFLSLLSDTVFYPCYRPLVKIYVVINEDGVDAMKGGVYRYEHKGKKIKQVSARLSVPVHKCHTPFNIAIAKQAKFYVFFITSPAEETAWAGEARYYYAFLESGMYGQKLMYHQSEYHMGMVPIGGMDFDKIRPDFHLKEDQICVHSLMCGGAKEEDLTDYGRKAAIMEPAVLHSEKEFPLSYGQQALYYEYRMDPFSSSYNTAYHVRIYRELKIDLLTEALQFVTQKYVLLRASFGIRDGEPYQRVLDGVEARIHLEEVGGLSEPELYERNREVYQQPLNLESGEVYRCHIFHISDNNYIFMFNVHHIVTDYVSMGIMIGDLWTYYDLLLQGRASFIEAAPDYKYKDFIAWQQEYVKSPAGKMSLAYWKELIKEGASDALFSNQKTRQSIDQGRSFHFTFPESLSKNYRDLSKKIRKTLNAILLSAYQLLLGIYFDKEKLTVGTMADARGDAMFGGVAGYFINPLLIYADLRKNITFLELTEQVNKQVFQALKHQDYPYPLLLSKMEGEKKEQNGSLFQVTFQFISQSGRKPYEISGMEPYTIPQQEGQFDLEMELIDHPEDGIAGRIAYNSAVFEEDKILQFYKHYLQLLNEILENPRKRLSEYEVVDQQEKKLLMELGSGEMADHPSVCIQHLVEEQALKLPDQTAVVAFCESRGRSEITYCDLNCHANRLARYLREHVDQEDAVIGICLKKSLDLVVSVLAVYKAGMTYVPIDPTYPQERYQFIIADTGAKAVLVSSGQKTGNFQRAGTEMEIDLDSLTGIMDEYGKENLNLPVPDSRLAYIIYTSGSTGQPKGVCIQHRGAVNTMFGYRKAYQLKEKQRHCQMSNITFDVFAGDFLRSLCCGGTMVLCNREILIDAKKLYGLITEEKISFAEFVPAVLRNLAQFMEREGLTINGMDGVVVSSDSWTMSDLKKFQRCFHEDTRFISAYGVTEASIDSTFMYCSEIDPDFPGFVPIGRPLINVKTYVVRRNMLLAPSGVAGELCIGGPGVAYEYLNRPELNQEKFIPDPFSECGGRLYRTGDLVRYQRGGVLEFLGRIDNQVKIRGLRIETGEIESILASYPGVSASCVIMKQDKFGEAFLVGYYVLSAGKKIDTDKLKQFCLEKLPEYMVPSIFAELSEFSLNSNGKIDKKAVQEVDVNRERDIVKPKTKLQKELAGVFKDVLDLEEIGVNEDFFTVGGHSFLTFRLLEELKTQLGYEVSLPDFLKKPTILELERLITSGGPEPQEEEKEEMIVSYWQCPEKIFLTGATGFLGCHLLASLQRLYQDTVIYCLVRGKDKKDAERSLEKSVNCYSLAAEIDMARVEVVNGDLEKRKLGLTDQQYEFMETKIDAIFHCGAYVNFAYPLEVLKKTNVTGTREIVKLAVAKRLKLIHYISTTSVYDNLAAGPMPDKVRIVVREDAPLIDNDKLHAILGYSQSKWYAEQLLQQARENGIMVNIYRPNIISGHSGTGIWNQADLAYKILRSAVQTRMVPDNGFVLNWSPVDYVSDAVAFLAKQGKCINQNFHLSSSHNFSFRDLAGKLTEYGITVTQMALPDWKEGLEKWIAGDPEQFAWLHEVLGFMNEWSPEQQLCYDTYNTEKGLEGSNCRCPEITADIIKKYCDFILA